MEDKKRKHISKFLSYVLRHRPDNIGLVLDKNGWTNVSDVIEKSKPEFDLTLEDLKEVAAKCDKQRFKFNEDFTKIKANQGHSVKVDLDLKPITPPEFLYHGTAERFLKDIMVEGLKKMNRHHVHLYKEEDIKKAKDTGQRHQKGTSGVILVIDAKKMQNDGFVFYKTDNNVYLTDFVHSKYIKKM